MASLVATLGLAPAIAQTGFTVLDDSAEPGGYDVTSTLKQPDAEFEMARQTNGDGYLLKVNRYGLQLDVTRNGKTQVLATSHESVPEGTTLVAQRRGPRWRIVLGNHVALEAEDDAFNDGQIAYQGAALDTRVQPVEPVVFDDDFMRVASDVAMALAKNNPRQGVTIATATTSETIWTGLQGKWEDTGLTENPAAQVAQSANPFAFKASASGINVAVAGHPFWSDYSAAISVQPSDAQAIGILLYVQNAQNYLGFKWSHDGNPQLVAVVNGVSRVLDEATGYGGFEQKQWYRLKIIAGNRTLRAFIDDTQVAQAQTDLFGRGLVGLFAQCASDKSSTTFDDAHVRPANDFSDDFGTEVPGRWKTMTGTWNLHGVARPVGTQGAYATMGEPGWTSYATSADIYVPADGSAGLVLHHIPGVGAYLMRVTGSHSALPYANTVEIARIGGGKTEVLAHASASAKFDNSKGHWTFSDDSGYLEAEEDGNRVLDAFDTSLPTGRAGIYAQAGPSHAPSLTHFTVEFPKEKPTWAKVPDLYELESQAQTMGTWSTPQGFWVPASVAGMGTPGVGPATPTPAAGTAAVPAADSDTTLWHKGEFFGDDTLHFLLPDLSDGKQVKLLFHTGSSGNLTVTFSLAPDLKVLISDGTKTWTGTTKLEGAATNQPMEVDRRGTWLIVKCGPPTSPKVVLAAQVG